MSGRPRIYFCLLLVLAMAWWLPAADHAAPSGHQDWVEVYFSPRGGCTDAIVREISRSQRRIYSFTSVPIAQALLEAHRRGVQVEVILDKSQKTARYSSATFLANQSVPVLIDEEHAIAHNKIILCDDHTVLTGSFNFSKAAEESNSENLLIIRGKADLFAAYEANYLAHRAHSKAYVAPASAISAP